MNPHVSQVVVFGFEPAIRAMRNPMDSWERSDSVFYAYSNHPTEQKGLFSGYLIPENPLLGENDLTLAKKLIWDGEEHRKFLRMIRIWVNLTIPRAVWTELDTYKIDNTRLSCSTMHRLGKEPILSSDFADEEIELAVLHKLNQLASQKRDDETLRKMKLNLPEGYYQMATYHFNYEEAINMFLQRRYHRLKEWAWRGTESDYSICDFLYKLPYFPDFIQPFLECKRFKTDEVTILRDLLSKLLVHSSNLALTKDERCLIEKIKK